MKTKEDPTGMGKNRTRGEKALRKQLTDAQTRVMKLFREIPRTRKQVTDIRNAETTTVYDYEITSEELLILGGIVAAILSNELLETTALLTPVSLTEALPPSNWFWRTIIERPYNSGTAESVVIFNQLINSIAPKAPTTGFPLAPISVQDVLLSPAQQTALDNVVADNTSKIRTLSQQTASQVMQQLNAGINSGKTPTEISANIQERFNVSRSNADRIARTEVNKAYNDSKIEFTEIAAQETGLRAGVIHVSALVPTTRRTHAARHGNAYTTAQQQQWWDTSPNRINCLCSTISVLIDSQGKVVESQAQQEIKAERSFFDT